MMKASVARRRHPSTVPAPPMRFRAAREPGGAVVPWATASPSAGRGRDLDAWLSSASRFGHRLPDPSERAEGSTVSSGPAAPIQRVIDDGLVHENLAQTSVGTNLSQWIQAHNHKESNEDPGARDKKSEQEYLHSQLKRLDKIEHSVYDWFGQNQDDSPERPSMFKLLDQVQQHHRKLIGRTARGGHDLWVKDNVDHQERGKINEVWNQVVSNQGNLSVERTVSIESGTAQIPSKQHGELRTEVLSDVARLMSRPKGRKLVEHLHTQGQDKSRQVKFRMHNLGALKKGIALSPLASNVSNEALVHESDGGIGKGEGSGAVVNLTPGVKDSDFSDFDVHGQRIPSPTFVTLGHELTHAAHFQRGTSAEGVKSDEIQGLSSDEGYHDDMEELLTIERTKDLKNMSGARITKDKGESSLQTLLALNKGIPTENDIREEHGLGLRYGHTTMATPEMYPGSEKGSDPADFVHRPQEIAKDVESANRWYKKPSVWLTGGMLLLALAGYYGPALYRRFMGE